MQHLNNVENMTKEEVLHAQQIALDWMNDAKHRLQQQLICTDDKKQLMVLDEYGRESARVNRALMELQNFAVDDSVGPEDLGDDARTIYDKVKNHF